MLAIADIPLNSTVSFDLHPAAILGASYKRAKILAIVDADSTPYFGLDAAAMHANVYPTLPGGVPNDHRAYMYLKLKLASGQITCVGIPWIVDASMVVETTRKIQITVDNVTPEQQNLIVQALSANGFGAVSIKYIDA